MIVLLTGASGGIGKYFVEALLAAGHTVAAQVLKGDLTPQDRLHVFQADLSIPAEREILFQQVKESLGNPEVFIHNAGINANAMSWKLPLDDWQKVMEVNVNAAFHLSSLCIPGMREKAWGRIVYISSIVAMQGVAGTSCYAASKSALLGLMRAQAAELASKNITVNALAPGYLSAGMIHQVPEDLQLKIKSNIPKGDFGDPAHLAQLALYLMGEQANYITGQTLHFNGGLLG